MLSSAVGSRKAQKIAEKAQLQQMKLTWRTQALAVEAAEVRCCSWRSTSAVFAAQSCMLCGGAE